MQIHILNREKIEKLAKTPFEPDTAVISIRDFDTEFAELENRPQHLIQLVFDDVDNDVFLDEPDLNRSEVEKKYNMLTDAQAQEIADFYFSVKDTTQTFICQCEHGQSRSAAVAAALLEFSTGRGIEIFADDRYYPNKMVFKKVLKQLLKNNI